LQERLPGRGRNNPRPLTFNAHYGLFRCLLTMFALLAVLSLLGLIWALLICRGQAAAFGIWTGLSTASAVIAYGRCKKRSEDFAQSVFDLFMAGTANKPSANDKP
jgi:hypothetical protein